MKMTVLSDRCIIFFQWMFFSGAPCTHIRELINHVSKIQVYPEVNNSAKYRL